MSFNLIQDEVTFDRILKEELGVLFYFSRVSCNVGEALEPKIIKLLEENFPKIPFYFVDMDKTPTIPARYSVFVEPTILVMFDGKETIRKSRIIGIGELSNAIERIYTLAFE
ncbi:MAG: thioredoxin family protein [Flavobacteriaceae bacterium]